MNTRYGNLNLTIKDGRAKVAREARLDCVILKQQAESALRAQLRPDARGLQYRSKLERAFHEELIARRHLGEFAVVEYEAINLRLAKNTHYRPDFFCITPMATIQFYECKGWMRDDAAVKLKVAAKLFPWAAFYLVTRKKGRWIEQEVTP